MTEPRRRSPLKRGAGAACTEGRNEVEDGARRCGPRSRPAGSVRRRGRSSGRRTTVVGQFEPFGVRAGQFSGSLRNAPTMTHRV